jgi:hypothetical protein
MEDWLLIQKAQIDAINTEVCGMVALNQYRISRDETIAYDDTAFQEKANELRAIADLINTYR